MYSIITCKDWITITQFYRLINKPNPFVILNLPYNLPFFPLVDFTSQISVVHGLGSSGWLNVVVVSSSVDSLFSIWIINCAELSSSWNLLKLFFYFDTLCTVLYFTNTWIIVECWRAVVSVYYYVRHLGG